MAHRLILRGMPVIEHRGDRRAGQTHVLRRLDVLDDAAGTGVHAACHNGNAAIDLFQRDPDGAGALLLGQRHGLAVGAGHQNAVQSALYAVLQQLPVSRFVHVLTGVYRRDNGGDDTMILLKHIDLLDFGDPWENLLLITMQNSCQRQHPPKKRVFRRFSSFCLFRYCILTLSYCRMK